ncbi:hypothetical protein B5M09_001472 [Aphanomyces astaci]|uniref:Uncharacterized protein n=1 Tax=Aphanomyces astaci TaxID=112090 RepID=A0A3R8D8Z6_APHAT|nr:hypothetical protein B5M09_001472 [Aphanomyces astaci]
MINLAGLLITRRYVYETLDDVHRKPSLTVISAWSASFRLCCREPAVLSLLLVYPIFGLGTLHMTAFPALRSIAHQLVSPHDRGCLHGRLAFVTTATMVIAEPVVKLIVRISIADDLQKKHPRPCPLGYRGVLDGYSNCGGMPGLVFSAASCLLMVVFAMAYLLVAPPATQRFKITLGPPVPRSACIEESSS